MELEGKRNPSTSGTGKRRCGLLLFHLSFPGAIWDGGFGLHLRSSAPAERWTPLASRANRSSSSSSRPVFGILLPPSLRGFFSPSFTCGGAKVRGAASAPDRLPWQPGPNNQRWHVNYGYYVMKTVPRKESGVAFLRRAGRTSVSEVKRRRQHNSEQNADASDSRSTKLPK